MTNLDALKILFEALGGDVHDVEDVQFNSDMIVAIAEQVEGGGGGLPEVTAEDNGDVLTVVDGVWDKATPSSGVMMVNVTYDEDSSTYTLDKTWLEIHEAMLDGVLVFTFYAYNNNKSVAIKPAFQSDAGGVDVPFTVSVLGSVLETYSAQSVDGYPVMYD